jgi:predicted nucleic acid-binding protein
MPRHRRKRREWTEARGEPDITDAWIAATAKIHALEVLTFNMADFRPMAVACRDPLVDPPRDAAD